MRFKSVQTNGLQAFAVTGVNTVAFAIEASEESKKGLLGFAIARGVNGKKPEFRPGFKVFHSVVSKPGNDMRVSTEQHPVQSFVWDDFTAEPETEYVYQFHPMRGTPKKPDLSADPVEIRVKTEALFSDDEHDIFFNRGVASSQAYARKFGNKRPSELSPAKQAEALQWLSRHLDEAMLDFIKNAKKGDGLLGCFYEFRYQPVVDELHEAIKRGVDVQVIVDGKKNGRTDKSGKKIPSFPREDNLAMIEKTGFPDGRVILREARTSSIHHNKFMVLLKGNTKKPTEVWTGSTNLSDGGIHGQTNVGHWVRNEAVAGKFKDYWGLLSKDPGGQIGDDRSAVMKKNEAFCAAVEAIQELPTDVTKIPEGVTAVFSPRTAIDVLNTYFDMIDKAQSVACITLAFGVAKDLKDRLKDNKPDNQIVFMLLEKEDKPAPPRKDAKPQATPPAPFVRLTARNNVYQAYGEFLQGDPVYGFAKETNAKQLEFNKHVTYIHSKFLVMDPLGDDPIVVTGSANFSKASTEGNDENMLIIRKNQRVADIYFTEFQRLFNHYYFRAVHTKAKRLRPNDPANSLFLREAPAEWLRGYKPGALRQKRVEMFAKMRGFTTL